jgi:hypothetical protein
MDSEYPKVNVKDMSDRELLESLHKRVVHIEANQSVLVHTMKKIALARGAEAVVEELEAHFANGGSQEPSQVLGE